MFIANILPGATIKIQQTCPVSKLPSILLTMFVATSTGTTKKQAQKQALHLPSTSDWNKQGTLFMTQALGAGGSLGQTTASKPKVAPSQILVQLKLKPKPNKPHLYNANPKPRIHPQPNQAKPDSSNLIAGKPMKPTQNQFNLPTMNTSA